ncbi:MAG: hypothetical protein AAF289_14500 [Cyanobacteria bacterium P01_A01_bin.135]
MIHGLMWLPLLAIFIGLAWAGWNEYRKVEAYQVWAESYDRAKYDVKAMLGQRGRQLVWGKPTRQGPRSEESVSLDQVQAVRVLVKGAPVTGDPPSSGAAAIELALKDGTLRTIPFTDVDLATQWCQVLEQDRQTEPLA